MALFGIYDDKGKVHIVRAVGIFVAVWFLLSFIGGSYALITAGHRGVILTMGKVEPAIMQEGFNFKAPFIQNVVEMSVQTQRYSSLASAASKDLQDVSTEVTLNYKLDENRVNMVYQQLGIGLQDSIIFPAIQEVVKSSTAKFTAEELVTKRDVVKLEIENALIERLNKFGGIIVQSISITDFRFSAEFTKAIEAKVTAEQLALKAQRDLDRIKIEAEQTVTSAKAEAEAIRLRGEAVRDNPESVAVQYLNKWNGVLPTVMSGDNSGMLLNIPLNVQ